MTVFTFDSESTPQRRQFLICLSLRLSIISAAFFSLGRLPGREKVVGACLSVGTKCKEQASPVTFYKTHVIAAMWSSLAVHLPLERLHLRGHLSAGKIIDDQQSIKVPRYCQ